jgi:zeaxanthin glucosyltransferase
MKKTSKNCIFYLLNTNSHYNSTFKVASELQNRGYNPIYVGGANMRRSVEENGFNFFEYSIKSFCINQGLNKGSFISEKDITERDLANYKMYFVKGGYFDEVIARFAPEIVFLDASKIIFFPELLRKNVKFVILCTKINVNKEPYVPPFNSSYIPRRKNVLTRIICELLWLKVLISKRIDNFLVKRKDGGFSLYELPFYYLKANNLKYVFKHINYNRIATFGIDNIPEIILSPEEFDYPDRALKKSQFYLAPSIYLQRKERIDEELKAFLRRGNLIYCSMGLYDRKYATVRINFINKLIQAFSSEPTYNIVISTGIDLEVKKGSQISRNMLIRQETPQLELLKHSSIMITHGGMLSITESILFSVPVLVYPLNPFLDQKGNAARVRFHNVGLVGNILSDSPLEIIRKVNHLMFNKEILKATKELRDRYLRSENFDKGMRILEQYLSKKVGP